MIQGLQSDNSRALLQFLIPTYKRPKSALHAVYSIVSQCSPSDASKIIIWINDDATPGLSYDELYQSISSFSSLVNIRITQNKVNLGMSSNIYMMAKEITASYWTVLTDDDCLEDNSLKSLLNTLEYAESIQCGSLISTRYCYTEAGDFLFKRVTRT